MTYTIDIAKKPMQMDLFIGKKLDNQCIFEIDGDTLRITHGGKKAVKGSNELVVADRPTKIDPDNLWTLKRVKK